MAHEQFDLSDADRRRLLAKVRQTFSPSRTLSSHLADVRSLEGTGGKSLAARLYGPVLPPKPKAGRPQSETVEFGLALLDEGKSRQEILSKACKLDPAYSEMSNEQQTEFEEKIWNAMLAARRRRARKGPPEK